MAPSLYVYTFKDGLLARLAHDLRLVLEDFEVRLEQGRIEARFQLRSLRVDGEVKADEVDTQALSARDRAQIRDNALKHVLDAAHHPEAVFTGQLAGTAEAPEVQGSLSLRGRTHPIEVSLRVASGQAVVRGRLVPSRWGIAPYKALGGAIKLEDAVEVELRLPLEGEVATPEGAFAGSHVWRSGHQDG